MKVKFDPVKGKAAMNADKKVTSSEQQVGFTKEEAEIYEASLKKIYKPTGLNIYDMLERIEDLQQTSSK